MMALAVATSIELSMILNKDEVVCPSWYAGNYESIHSSKKDGSLYLEDIPDGGGNNISIKINIDDSNLIEGDSARFIQGISNSFYVDLDGPDTPFVKENYKKSSHKSYYYNVVQPSDKTIEFKYHKGPHGTITSYGLVYQIYRQGKLVETYSLDPEMRNRGIGVGDKDRKNGLKDDFANGATPCKRP